MSKRKIQGIVVSDKMDKTRVVKVDRLVRHAKYEKFYKTSKKFKAHDEKNETKVGDSVTIEEARPMSREKRWRIVKI